ncbi:hypothetical protein OS493_034310 [Desmophyllum pertusum]|uniref:Peptidase C1A papain C-terminal domain-containing protein n=1 Tax=Desmophyllum pertusum TaxID=174260 RepID=A0A9W9YWP0_9CNID|nr:hypothetical protein OS493_034310 [Desmophyllum pertusum]
MAVLFAALVVLFASCQAKYLHEPLTKEAIDDINLYASWTADPDYAGYDVEHFKSLCGVPLDDNVPPRPKKLGILPVKTDYEAVQIPDTFDAREQWPNCSSIKDVRDQGSCGNSWAVGAAGAITDRICIHSGGKLTPYISAQDLTSCCGGCGYGCNGGFPEAAWSYWVYEGIVTGGQYLSHQGCDPYQIPSCDHHVKGKLIKPCGRSLPTPTCTWKCEAGYNSSFFADKRYGTDCHAVTTSVEAIQTEIMTYGPVEGTFNVFADFPPYKTGVYKHTSGGPLGGHSVKILGWGTENNTAYWLAANSWNAGWGDRGFFKILRGENECGIEAGVVAGLPKMEEEPRA